MSEAITGLLADPTPQYTRDVLAMYVVYLSPLDYPGLFVVRRHEARMREGQSLEVPTSEHWTAQTLGEARARIPPAYDYRMPRHPCDDLCIVETWI